VYIKYLKTLLRHKWFVFLEGLKIGCNPFLLFIHDSSKFLPDEFVAYARSFAGPWKYSDRPKDVIEAFDRAWLFHQHRNKHHWQHWILTQDDDPTMCVEMPVKYVLEMVADWRGAGRAYGKTSRGDDPNTVVWYSKRRNKIKLHPNTRQVVEDLLLGE
jgi:hypothetical protein